MKGIQYTMMAMMERLHGRRFFPIFLCMTVLSTGVLFAEQKVQQNNAGRSTLSLAGQWAFKLDPNSAGLKERWYAERLPGTVVLPGSLDEQKLGVRNPQKQINCLTREYEYVGPAWYQKEITVPEDWKDKRITLFLERCHWESGVWVNDHYLGVQNSLSVPHVYDLTDVVQPGKNTIIIRVDNTVKINIGHSLGDAQWAHAITDQTQTNWNGIIGRIELCAAPKVWIDSAQMYPDFQKKLTTIKAVIGNTAGMSAEGKLDIIDYTDNVSVKDVSFRTAGEKTTVEIQLPFAANPTLWDEFSPSLHRLEIVLSAKTEKKHYSHQYSATLGLRNFVADGQHFKLNGRTIFLRGNLDCCIFPLTGYPPMTVQGWKDYLGIIQRYGMNHIRFHSWCPPEAAFTAADEMGIMFHIEPPLWDGYGLVGSDIKRAGFILQEVDRIVDRYGNHPSFCLMSMGNELGDGSDPYLAYVVDYLKKKDARHLYTSTTHPSDLARKDDYFVSAATQKGGVRGDNPFMDFRDSLVGYDRPLIAHEVAQPAMYPDYREISKYTGPLKPRNMETFRDSLEKKGMLGLAEKFHRASGALLVDIYKENIEIQLRTPTIAGFQLLGLQDFPGHGTALIGVLDAFCDSKGLITAEAFRQFCSPTVPLIRMKGFVWTANETLMAVAEVAHYGPADLKNQSAVWHIKNTNGKTVASGNFGSMDIPTGKTTELGKIEVKLDAMAAPAKFTVEIALKDTPFQNSWNFWVYPETVNIDTGDTIHISNKWDAETQKKLASGGKVLLFPRHKTLLKVEPSRWHPVFWSVQLFGQQPETMGILCDPKHPVFDQFPTDFYGSWQWRDLLNQSEALVLDDIKTNIKPIVQFVPDFNRNRKMAAMMEARVGKGALIICMMDLQTDIQTRPAAKQLLSSLLNYMKSGKFAPSEALAFEELNRLLELRSSVELSNAPSSIGMAALNVKASRAAPFNQPHPWSRENDEVVKQEDGFGYQIQGNSWRDAAGATWYDGRLLITVDCPAGFVGTFYAHFHDWNSQGRTAMLYFTGHDLGPLSRYDGQGVWIKVPVTEQMSAKEKLTLDARTTSGPNTMVSQIILMHRDE